MFSASSLLVNYFFISCWFNGYTGANYFLDESAGLYLVFSKFLKAHRSQIEHGLENFLIPRKRFFKNLIVISDPGKEKVD